jgi:homocysteine S-methyltransferase
LDRSLCELNLTRPQLVRDLHSAYISAGARVVQTNTFDANRLRLTRVGLEDSVVEINIAGARLARDAARDRDSPVLVAGSVGPAMSASLVPRMPRVDRASVLREQIAALANWVDLIVLETFGDIESLIQAVDVAGAECDLPVVAQLTFGDDGRTLRGEDPAEVAAVLSELDIAALGANCTVGPAVLRDVVAVLAAGTTLPVSVQPNAGTPRRLGRQLRYAHNVEYFAEAAREFVASGATIVGGCCGTTPAHIKAIAKAVAGMTPVRRPSAAAPATGRSTVHTTGHPPVSPVPAREAPVAWPYADDFVVLAGMRAPRGQDTPEFAGLAKELIVAGVDLLAITDPDPFAARVNPVAAAVLLSERVGAEVIVELETADRSLAALQADLLGANALGLRLVACRTGTPRVAGDYPDPGSQWDVDSVRLIAALSGLNEGVDWRGVPTPHRTRFVIGAFVRIAAADQEHELRRVAQKVAAGAHFLLTDVIHNVGDARRFLGELRGRGMELPVIAGLAPFEDPATVARLTHEAPEVHTASGPLPTVDTALETVEQLGDLVSGVLVHAPAHLDSRMIALVENLCRHRRSA